MLIIVLISAIIQPTNSQASTAGTSRIFAPVQDGPTDVGEEVLPYAPRRLLVKLRANAMNSVRAQGGPMIGIESLDTLGRQLQVKGVRPAYGRVGNRVFGQALGIDRWHIIELDQNGDILRVVARYAANPNVEVAVPDWRAFPLDEPNDPLHSTHWGHDNNSQLPDYCWYCGGHENGIPVGMAGFDANAEDAWDKRQGYGDSAVVIAILDTGLDLDHPDLQHVVGWDYGSGDSNPDDDSSIQGHGTACAGVAAAISNNGIGTTGAAGGASIMPLKVANASGVIYFSAIQNALYHAADNEADIVSMSIGAAISNDPATDTAIQYAYNKGVTLFAATGNANATTILYPANHALVIAVGAASPCGGRKRSSSYFYELNPGVYPDPNDYTCDGERWWGSNYGTSIRDAAGAVDIIAPTILPTTDITGINGYSFGDYYQWFNGTSAATPYAAGVAALILSANPTWTPSQIRQQLIDSATDVVNVESGVGWDRYSGYGMINAAAAIGDIPLPSGDAYGNIKSGDQSHIDEVNYSFGGLAGDVALYYEAWDVDSTDEIEIVLNGAQIGYAPETGNDSWGGMQVITLPDALVNDSSDNYLTFNNTRNPPSQWRWGVRNVSVAETSIEDTIPLPSNDAYGNIKSGDQSHINEVNYSFGGFAGDVEFYYEAWDVDSTDEIEIVLNGAQIGYAPETGNDSWGGMQVITLPDALVNDSSDNYLTFNNTSNPPNQYWWGVRNVSVSNP